jgi:hypothetical protein
MINLESNRHSADQVNQTSDQSPAVNQLKTQARLCLIFPCSLRRTIDNRTTYGVHRYVSLPGDSPTSSRNFDPIRFPALAV